MKFVSLFSGFGGLDLGLERAGMRCVLQVEIKLYAQKVLTKLFPDTPKHEDIRTLFELPAAEVLAGGFPCQDVSNAGSKLGLDGEKSGLWREFERVIRLRRWEYIIIENTTGLLAARKGRPAAISRVLTELSTLGYDAEWEVIPAKAFGEPHERERVFIAAYPMCKGLEGERIPIFHTSPPSRSVRGIRLSESDVVRRPSTIPFYRDRIEGLGNMVHVGVAEWVGNQVLEHARGAVW